MGTAAVRGKRTLQRRRIIQRPRLLALLDASNARVRTLIASAGYGKSTLAEQWIATGERRSAWYTVRRASVDVAGLALGLARACSVIIAGSDERLRAHLKAVSASPGSSTVLAEILCEDLANWPSDAWLVVDDYHEISGSDDAESFFANLVSGCPLQMLVTSRQRPAWVTARSILYGEVLEVGQASLAMDPQEAAEVLADWSGPAASGLVALANGWPAVIGLASVSSAEIEREGDATVPESLYRFFADEVFDALGDDVRDGLAVLAVAPVLDQELADELLGHARAELVCGTAIDIGLLVERDSRLELHPLARSFLDERAAATPAPSAIATCLAHYRETRDWDAAFDLIVRRDVSGEFEGLLEAALDDLLDWARLSTIEEWCGRGDPIAREAPILALARAETALRRGRHRAAQIHAEAAAVDERYAFRSLSVAGRAAHLASREEEAVALYRRAKQLAENERDRREALFGELVSLVDLESTAAMEAMNVLRSAANLRDPGEVVRLATASLSYRLRFDSIDLDEADVAYEMLDTFSDPLVESSFLSVYSTSLALSARYPEALAIAARLHEIALSFRFDFAIPYAMCWSAMSYTGMRRWAEAEDAARQALDGAGDGRSPHAMVCGRAILLRALAQQHRFDEALEIRMPSQASIPPAARAEFLNSRALVLAATGRVDEARRVLQQTRGTTRAVEAVVLAAAVEAVIALKSSAPDAAARVLESEHVAYTTGATDLLVCTYRTAADFLAVLLTSSATPQFRELIRQVGDEDVADACGHRLQSKHDEAGALSPREREVHDLICQGLTDRQIAKALVIEVSTVKRHAHHIYEKLGIHSRRELLIRSALRRQATSATAAESRES